MKNLSVFLYKVIKFFKNYLFKDPIFVFKYFLAYFQSGYVPQAKFYTVEEFMQEIKKGKSFIRIGDGEIGLLHHRDISYQKADPLLISKLTEIIESYGKENNSNEQKQTDKSFNFKNNNKINKDPETDNNKESNYILSIPIFVNTSNKDLENTKGKLSCWLPLKVEFFRRFNRDMKYFDAHAFYRKGFFESHMYEYLKDKKLIINTNKQNIENQKENIEKRFNVIEWIEAKSPNPFDNYEETKEKIQNIVDREISEVINEAEDHKETLRNKDNLDFNNINNLNKEEKIKEIKRSIVLILGSGPMSKVLAYDFAQQGIQGIDIGKGFEQLYNEVDYEAEI